MFCMFYRLFGEWLTSLMIVSVTGAIQPCSVTSNDYKSRLTLRLLRSWVRIPPGAWIFVCCECRVLSGRGLCDELITRPEESYRLCCVVCDLETSRMGAPYIYVISHQEWVLHIYMTLVI